VLLSLLIVAHSVYLWRLERKRKDRQPWPAPTKTFLSVLAILYAAAVVAGLAVVIARLEPSASQALGGVALLLAVWFDFRLGRACGK
jgi:hypothetical protein